MTISISHPQEGHRFPSLSVWLGSSVLSESIRKVVHGLLKRFLNLDDYGNLDVLFALKQLYDLTVRPNPKVDLVLVIIRLAEKVET